MIIKFTKANIQNLFTRLDGYCKDGFGYVIEIHKAKDKRSLSQNKYYWGVIVTLFSQQSGYTINESHQALAGMFLKYEKDGQIFTKSTTELDTKMFEQYAEKCRFFMQSEMGINVPLPNEITQEGWMQLQNIYNY